MEFGTKNHFSPRLRAPCSPSRMEWNGIATCEWERERESGREESGHDCQSMTKRRKSAKHLGSSLVVSLPFLFRQRNVSDSSGLDDFGKF